MPEFLTLLPPRIALGKLLDSFIPRIAFEKVHTTEALNRVTAEPLVAPHSLPTFPRATVDGFAVRSKDTHGTSATLPAYLELVSEIPMGVDSAITLQKGQCALIHTGGMIPKGADAAIMVEHTQQAKAKEIEILRAVAIGENVCQVGEDTHKGEEIIPAGKLLRPAEIGALMALGIIEVRVSCCPKIGIISSGDEVIPPDQKPKPGQVRDINSYTLRSLVLRTGGEPFLYGIIPDDYESLSQTAAKALSECELVILTAGSSASERDLTSQVINNLGRPGVLVHGINLRPGKPTILGVCDGKPVLGLPGNPVSALVVAELFLKPLIAALLGRQDYSPWAATSARLTINLASQSGREDWIPVRIIESENELLAEPIFGKSNLIFTLVQADGLICIAPDANGIAAGEEVKVFFM